MYFLADITKKVPIYIHFVEKLQTFDLRALGGSFCQNFDGGQFILFYDRALMIKGKTNFDFQGNTRDVLHKFTVDLPKKHGAELLILIQTC